MYRSLCWLLTACLLLSTLSFTRNFPLGILPLATVAHAQTTVEKVSGYCERGGQKVTTAGQTSTTTVQKSYPSCTVTVYQTGTSTLQTIYSNSSLAIKSNPFTADANGYFEFYSSVTQRLDVQLSGGTAPNNIATPFFWKTDLSPGSGSVVLSNLGVTLSPQRSKIDLPNPFLTATDDSTRQASSLSSKRTPTGVYNAVTDLNISADPRLYETSVNIPSGATSVVLTGVTKETRNGIPDGATNSVYPLRYYANSLNTWKVGQGIRIPDGVSTGVDLIATITAVSGNTLTFTPATTNANSIDFIQHDDTAAVRSWFSTYTSGTLQIPDGWIPVSSFYSYNSSNPYALSIPASSEALNQQWIIEGSAEYRSAFVMTGPGHLFKPSGTNLTNLNLRKLGLFHANRYQIQTLDLADTTGAALYLQSDQYNSEGVPQSGATAVKLDKVRSIGFKYGIISDNLQSSSINDFSCYYCNNGIFLPATSNVRGLGSQTEPNANTIRDSFFQYSTVLPSNARRSITVTTAGAHNTSGVSIGTASNVITVTSGSVSSTDLYRLVKITGASVNQTEHTALITRIISSTSFEVSQPPWIATTGLTATLYPRAFAQVYTNNANNITIDGGTWQGNWTNSTTGDEVYAALYENSDQITHRSIWVEGNGGSGGAAVMASSVRGFSFLNSNVGANGTPTGYTIGLRLNNVQGAKIDEGSYIGTAGDAAADIYLENGTRGVTVDNTTLTSPQSILYGNTIDSTPDFYPPKIGLGVRYLEGTNSGPAYDTADLYNTVFGRGLLLNGSFARGLTSWTQTAPGALTAVNAGTDRGLRYIQVAPTTGGGNAYAEQMSQTINVPNGVAEHQTVTLGFDFYIVSRGADAITSGATYNELRVKLIPSVGTTGQFGYNPSAAQGRIIGRWERGSITTRIGAGTGRTLKVQIECGQGANAAVFRVANFRLLYGTKATYDEDEPITELRGGTLQSNAVLTLVNGIGTGTRTVCVDANGVVNSFGCGGGGTTISSVREAVNVKRDHSCAGDGVTNDTACIVAAITSAQSTGKELYFPTGTYLTDTITQSLSNLVVIGDGYKTSIIKARNANTPIINVTGANYAVDLVIQDLGFTGQGPTSGSSGHCIVLNDVGVSGSGLAQATLRNVYISQCGGKGLYVPRMFNVLLDSVVVDQVGGNGFELHGSNTTTLIRTYVKTLSGANTAAYRIYAGTPTLIGANGIDSCPNGGCDWGVFGRTIADDGVESYVRLNCTNCNIEDFKNRGIYFKYYSSGNFFNTSFYAPTSGTVRALKYDYVDDTIQGIFDGQSSIVTQGASWTNGYPIHSNANPFHSFSITANPYNKFWNGTDAQSMPQWGYQFASGISRYLARSTGLAADLFQVGTSGLPTGYQSFFKSTATGNIGLAIAQITSQTAPPFVIENDSASPIFRVTTTGALQTNVSGGLAFTVQDTSANALFRAARSNAWADSTASSFAQLGGSGESGWISGLNAATLPRLGVTATKTQITDTDTGTAPAPGSTLFSLYKTTSANTGLEIKTSSVQAGDIISYHNSSAVKFKVDASGYATTERLRLSNVAGDPSSPANGDIAYNSTAGKFRCYQAGAWTDCIGSGGGGSGITAISGTSGGSQTGPSIALAVGTSGTDITFPGSGNTLTLNVPDASASARGVIKSSGSQTLAPNFTLTGTLAVQATTTARQTNPEADNTYSLGTSALRWAEMHVAGSSLVVHGDNTNTKKVTYGYSGSTGTITADASSSIQVTTGANSGLTINTSGNATFGGTVAATSFSGAGGSLTGLSGTNISTGTVGVTVGGTAQTAWAANEVLVGTGVNTVTRSAIPSCSNATTSKLLYNNSTQAFTCGTDQTSGSGTGITDLNGLTGAAQTFVNDTNVTMVSSGTTHTLTWAGTLAVARGGTGAATLTGVLIGNGTSAFTAVTAPSGTIVGTSDSQTLTNKVLTAPDINGGTADALTSLGIRSTGTGAFDLQIINTENLTGNKALTITLNDAAKTINLGGNLVIASSLTTTNGAVTFNGSGGASVTLPTSGTLATLAGSESLTNKKLGSLTSNGLVTTSGGDGTLSVTVPGTNVLTALGVTLNNASGGLVTADGTATLASKTLTAPKFADLGFIADANGNELLILDTVTSAVNEVTFANAATGANPTFTASGGDTNVGLDFQTKGTGVYRLLATASGPTDLRLFEDADNGSNYASLLAPSLLASNVVATLPSVTGTLLTGTVGAGELAFGSSGAITSSADFTYTTATGRLDISKSLNSSVPLVVTNGSSGAAAQARVATSSDVSGATIAAYSSGFTPSAGIVAGAAVLDLDGAAAIIKGQSGGSLRMLLGGTEHLRLTSSGLAFYGSSSGSTVITAAAAASGTLTLPAATDTLVGKATTDTLTNKTIDAEGTGNTLTIPIKIWIDAAANNAGTAAANWDLPSSNAPAAAAISGTNVLQGVMDFADGATDLTMQRTLRLPSDWTGNIDINFKWLSATTSGDVIWGVATACVADAETNDPSFNSYSDVTDTTKGTTNQTNDASISSITVTGCAAGELMHVKVARRLSQAGDTMAGTARLIGVELTWRRAL